MEALSALAWGALTAAGSTLALTLIVAIAVGISGLTLLFVGSAVVALEQFARANRRWQSLLGCALLWSLFGGYAVMRASAPELVAAGRS